MNTKTIIYVKKQLSRQNYNSSKKSTYLFTNITLKSSAIESSKSSKPIFKKLFKTASLITVSFQIQNYE